MSIARVVAAAGAAFLASSAMSSALAFSQVVAFGDSLSDSGKLYEAFGGSRPAAPVYHEGRFSNGRVAV